MYINRTSPYQPYKLAHIWRPLYCLNYMRKDNQWWNISDQNHLDAGYCLDRYSLIDAPNLKGKDHV